ncbi:Hpt domain-containing protein [Cerasicoccus arenae]|nr:Hpt domain-containing protein [Cerasicoccus arenae]MBK1857450.1 Hpt domain-containing protein [Cerasicoccus arenae]
MNTFEHSYAEQVVKIDLACQQENTEVLISLVHYVKGSLGNLGLARAAAYARQAETELRIGKFQRFSVFSAKLDYHKTQGLKALKARYD